MSKHNPKQQIKTSTIYSTNTKRLNKSLSMKIFLIQLIICILNFKLQIIKFIIFKSYFFKATQIIRFFILFYQQIQKIGEYCKLIDQFKKELRTQMHHKQQTYHTTFSNFLKHHHEQQIIKSLPQRKSAKHYPQPTNKIHLSSLQQQSTPNQPQLNHTAFSFIPITPSHATNPFLQQKIQLKIQLTKLKSKLESYKQFQSKYKQLLRKLEIKEGQERKYKQFVGMVMENVGTLMKMVGVSEARGGDFGNGRYEKGKKMFSQQNNGKLNNINNEKQLSSAYLSGLRVLEQQQQFSSQKHQLSSNIPSPITTSHLSKIQTSFQILQNRLNQLLLNNQQLHQTIKQNQKSQISIQLIQKQQHLMLAKLQAMIKIKDLQIQKISQQLAHIKTENKYLNSIKMEHENKIQNLNDQNLKLLKSFTELQSKIQQFHQHQNQSYIRQSEIKQKCQNILQELEQHPNQLLVTYLERQKYMVSASIQISSQKEQQSHKQNLTKNYKFNTNKPAHSIQLAMSKNQQKQQQRFKQGGQHGQNEQNDKYYGHYHASQNGRKNNNIKNSINRNIKQTNSLNKNIIDGTKNSNDRNKNTNPISKQTKYQLVFS